MNLAELAIMRIYPARNDGFTLVEVLLSLAICCLTLTVIGIAVISLLRLEAAAQQQRQLTYISYYIEASRSLDIDLETPYSSHGVWNRLPKAEIVSDENENLVWDVLRFEPEGKGIPSLELYFLKR